MNFDDPNKKTIGDMMEEIIVATAKTLQRAREKDGLVPKYPTELDIQKGIMQVYTESLSTLIGDGTFMVDGITLSKHRILRLTNKDD